MIFEITDITNYCYECNPDLIDDLDFNWWNQFPCEFIKGAALYVEFVMPRIEKYNIALVIGTAMLQYLQRIMKG